MSSPLLGKRRPRGRWLLWTAVVLAVVAIALLAATWASSEHFDNFGGTPSRAALESAKPIARYADGHFINDEPTSVMKVGMLAAAKDWLSGDEMTVPTCPLPMMTDIARVLAQPPLSGLRVTWLGHSTTLIEIDGARVLTDPMWSDRASPSTWVGPKRFHPPPLALADVPKPDAIVISHDHYDHLDMTTVRAFAVRGVVIHVALGVGSHLQHWGIPQASIVEHDWWQATPLPHGVQVVSTPARHFSGRGLRDRNRTLWTSWSIIGPRHRVFFSGDTGLTKAFANVAQKFGPFDVAMLEIGQFHPSWGDIHLGPRGALEAFTHLRAAKFLPIHWSTFELGLHPWSEPAETVTVEGAKRGIAVLTPRLGEPVEPTTNPTTTAWWRALPPTAARCP